MNQTSNKSSIIEVWTYFRKALNNYFSVVFLRKLDLSIIAIHSDRRIFINRNSRHSTAPASLRTPALSSEEQNRFGVDLNLKQKDENSSVPQFMMTIVS